MFESLKKDGAKSLDEAIKQAYSKLETLDVGSKEYSDALEHYERLYAVKGETRKRRVSSDTVLIVLGNLLGILIIVAYEQKHVFASKATSFAMKMKH